MEKKWLISVEDGSLENVAENLKEKDIKVLEVLEAIGVIIVVAEKLKMKDIKNIDGILSVEEERNNSV